MMKRITLRIKTGELKGRKDSKRYPIRYGEPIVIINPNVVKELIKQMRKGRREQ